MVSLDMTDHIVRVKVSSLGSNLPYPQDCSAPSQLKDLTVITLSFLEKPPKIKPPLTGHGVWDQQ